MRYLLLVLLIGCDSAGAGIEDHLCEDRPLVHSSIAQVLPQEDGGWEVAVKAPMAGYHVGIFRMGNPLPVSEGTEFYLFYPSSLPATFVVTTEEGCIISHREVH